MPTEQTQFPTTAFPAAVDVTTLNQKTGLTITGAESDDMAGFSVARAGDVNFDGIDDLMVGAPGTNNGKGASYLIFGAPHIANIGNIPLSNLGNRGFIIPGIDPDGLNGASVGGVGDVNHDGIDDFVVVAPFDAPSVDCNTCLGTVSVVFGRTGIGYSGQFSLAGLNGRNGFNITNTVPMTSFLQAAVNRAVDVNGDGINDVVIGLQSIESSPNMGYVIFGGPNIGSTGTFNLTELNGKNGFILTGGPGQSWHQVAAAGDINHDGIDDLAISAPRENTTYLLFGSPNIGYSGNFNIFDLNGSNGFTITGARAGSQIGFALASGDFNGDEIDDLLIGAPDSDTGNAYMIFGVKKIGHTGTVTLMSLNGRNGFNITGVNSGDNTGWAVDSIGDFNGDGIADFVIGAPYAKADAGMSCILFGAPNIGNAGTVALSNLNGNNGFCVPGNARFGNGGSVSGVSDVNHDGIPDLIIGTGLYLEPTAPLSVSYILFGNKISQLTCNGFTIDIGKTLLLNTSHFNATYLTQLSKNLAIRFTISNIEHGRFSTSNNPFNYITTFTLQDVVAGNIQFTHDGSGSAPVFNTQIGDGGLASISPQPANITFIHKGAQLIHNNLTVDQGKTVTVLYSDLAAVNLDDASKDTELTFLISELQHGFFQLAFNPGKGFAVTSFTLGQIETNLVQFVHDGSTYAPCYNVSVSDGTMSTASAASIVQFYLTPILVNNSLNIHQGEHLVLTNTQLGALDPGINSDNLLFTANNIAGGSFQLPGNVKTSSFTQAQVNNALVVFMQDGTSTPPSYGVILSNGRPGVSVGPQYSNVTFTPSTTDHSLDYETKIILSVIGGVIGLGFFILQLIIKFYVEKTLKNVFNAESKTESGLKLAALYDNVIKPLTEKFFCNINTTYFQVFRSESSTREFILAIELIVTHLDELHVPMYPLSAEKQTRLFNEILNQIKRVLVPPHDTCSRSTVAGFFKPAITPAQLAENASAIAVAVATALRSNTAMPEAEAAAFHREDYDALTPDDDVTLIMIPAGTADSLAASGLRATLFHHFSDFVQRVRGTDPDTAAVEMQRTSEPTAELLAQLQPRYYS